MTGNVTWDAVISIAGIVGACFVVWFLVEKRVDQAKTAAYFKVDEAGTKIAAAAALASTAREELATYKTHVAETYVTKAGMHEQTTQIMKAIDSVGDKIDRTNERLDRVFEHQQPVRPRRGS